MTTTDSAALEHAASAYAEAEEELNRSTGRGSDCQFVSRPFLICSEGLCIEGQAPSGKKQ
jgi:hypothetical protein